MPTTMRLAKQIIQHAEFIFSGETYASLQR